MKNLTYYSRDQIRNYLSALSGQEATSALNFLFGRLEETEQNWRCVVQACMYAKPSLKTPVYTTTEDLGDLDCRKPTIILYDKNTQQPIASFRNRIELNTWLIIHSEFTLCD